MILAQSTFTIKRLAKDELSLVFSSDTVTIPVNNGVADLSIAEFGVKVLKGGRELFPEFDEEIDIPTDWTSAPEDILSNAIITPHNCTAVVENDKIKITSITPDKRAGYVDVAVSCGEDNTALRRFTWATSDWESVKELKIEYDSKWLNTEQELTSLKSRTTSVEDITTGHQTRIEEAESSIAQTAVEIALKVSKDGIVSSINQTPELIKIDANKIEFTGSVSFQSAAQEALEADLTGLEQDITDAIEGAGNKTFFVKPENYKKGDRWILIEDTELNGNFYEKGQALEAVYATGEDSDWRLLVITDETEGVNLIRNYSFKEQKIIVSGVVTTTIPHWGGTPKEAIVSLTDAIPTEYYSTQLNILGDEYGSSYGLTTEDDEIIILDE